MLSRARPGNLLKMPRSERVGGKRHDRLFASRHACRERLRLRQHALDEIIGNGALGAVLRRIARSGRPHADPHPAIRHKPQEPQLTTPPPPTPTPTPPPTP